EPLRTRDLPALQPPHSRGSSGEFRIPASCSSSRSPKPPESAKQQDQAHDHGKCIVIEHARLHAAHAGGKTTDHAAGAIDQHAVDERTVTTTPQHATECATATGKHGEIHLVDPELA